MRFIYNNISHILLSNLGVGGPNCASLSLKMKEAGVTIRDKGFPVLLYQYSPFHLLLPDLLQVFEFLSSTLFFVLCCVLIIIIGLWGNVGVII